MTHPPRPGRRTRLPAVALAFVLIVAGCAELPLAGDRAAVAPSRDREQQAGGGGGGGGGM